MLREKIAELGLDDTVHLFPFTSEPVHVFELLDVLVLPSLYKEGLPNVLLEAMSMSVPVVASQLAGVSEVVLEGETGYTVEPVTRPRWRTRSTGSGRTEMGTAACQSVRERSWWSNSTRSGSSARSSSTSSCSPSALQRTPESQLQSRTRLPVAGVEAQGDPKGFGSRSEVASSQPRPSHVPVREGVDGALDEQLLEQLGGPLRIPDM